MHSFYSQCWGTDKGEENAALWYEVEASEDYDRHGEERQLPSRTAAIEYAIKMNHERLPRPWYVDWILEFDERGNEAGSIPIGDYVCVESVPWLVEYFPDVLSPARWDED